MLDAKPEPSLDHMGAARVRIPELLRRLRQALTFARTVSFDTMVTGRTRLEEALTLLAVLEMARVGEVALEQPVPFGDITISRS
jgi:chromatin segregation and condensation protein Rec8/ScpA/Scc1 (kleisin family)